ncbi:hypothetical protein [Sporofaciens sp. JLR.KK001]|uniref:hypothetical protein n=1 Tax=Sporofaciens sp. JLR.KK001 TaxID=3112621 RepID=UPI002FF0277E
MDIKPRRKRCEKGILRRKTERRKCYPQEIPEDKILLTFCPQTYHLLWIKIFSISAHLPTLSKKPITGVGVKSNVFSAGNGIFRQARRDRTVEIKKSILMDSKDE